MRLNINKYFIEWVKTLSSKSSFFSSKRLERFTFTSIVVLAYISLVVYLIIKDKFTATEFTIASIPLLIAAGYNMSQTEKAKSHNKEENNGQV